MQLSKLFHKAWDIILWFRFGYRCIACKEFHNADYYCGPSGKDGMFIPKEENRLDVRAKDFQRAKMVAMFGARLPGDEELLERYRNRLGPYLE